MRKLGFTLVEVLVVISIIALLFGILLPVLGKSRETSRATVCLSNIRQWGIGSLLFAQDHADYLPLQGEQIASGTNPTNAVGTINATDVTKTFNEPLWVYNAVPVYMNSLSYKDCNTTTGTVPFVGNNSLFVCPTAQSPLASPYTGGGYQYWTCYMSNSSFRDGTDGSGAGCLKMPGAQPTTTKDKTLKLTMIPKPSVTVFLAEQRTIREEISTINPLTGSTEAYYNQSVNRVYGNWKRVAARHPNGTGNYLMLDGSGKSINYAYASCDTVTSTTPSQPTSAPGEFNKPDLIWNPLGPSGQ